MDTGTFWLTEAQLGKLAPLLPTDTRGKARVDDRRVISGIVQVLVSGCPWADAPAHYGPRKTLYNRYVRWAAKGLWPDLFKALAAAGGPPAQSLIDAAGAGPTPRRRPVAAEPITPDQPQGLPSGQGRATQDRA